MKTLAFATVLLLTAASAPPFASQELTLDADHAAPRKNHVMLLDDAVLVDAGKPQDIELRFRVDAGLHVNSHAPQDELLLPTVLTLEPVNGVKVLSEEYPAGVKFHLNIGAGETLDVYQGEFRVHVRLVAARGANVLTGALHYQACDTASCFPPRTLPLKVVVTGR